MMKISKILNFLVWSGANGSTGQRVSGHFENALDFERKSLFSAYLKAGENATSKYQGRKTFEKHEKRKEDDKGLPLVTRIIIREARSVSIRN